MIRGARRPPPLWSRTFTTMTEGSSDSRSSMLGITRSAKPHLLSGNGINLYANTLPGFEGYLKNRPEDFIVKEIRPDGTICEESEMTKDIPDLPYEYTQAAETARALENEATKHQWNGDMDDCLEVLQQNLGANGLIQLHQFAIRIAEWKGIVVPQFYKDEFIASLNKANLPSHSFLFPKGGLDRTTLTEDIRTTSDMELVIRLPEEMESSKHLRGQLRRSLGLYPFLNSDLLRVDEVNTIDIYCNSGSAQRSNKCLGVNYDAQVETLQEFVPSVDYFLLLLYMVRTPRHPFATHGVVLRLPQDRSVRKRFFGLLHSKFKYLEAKHAHSVNTDKALKHQTHQEEFEGHKICIFYKKARNLKRLREDAESADTDIHTNKLGKHIWTHFLLRKYNQEHVMVTRALGSSLSASSHQVITAGIKDKAAITIQRACIQGVPPKSLLQRIYKARTVTDGFSTEARCLASVDVGGFSYGLFPLQVGELGGNHFDIVIRPTLFSRLDDTQDVSEVSIDDQQNCYVDGVDIELKAGAPETCFKRERYHTLVQLVENPPLEHSPRDVSCGKLNTLTNQKLQHSLDALRTFGFINYYGTQRVGNGFTQDGYSSSDIGASLYRGSFIEAVHRVMLPRVGSFGEERKARMAWYRRADPEEVSKMFPLRCTMQHMILNHLRKHTKSLYDDSQDSEMASFCAIDNVPYGTKTIWLHSYQSLVWNRMATIRLRLFGSQPVVGDLVLLDTSRDSSPVDIWSRISVSADKLDVHTLTREDLERRSFGMEHVVLPVPGRGVMYPLNAIGEAYFKHLASDDTVRYLWPVCAEENTEMQQKADDASTRRWKQVGGRSREIAARCGSSLPTPSSVRFDPEWLYSIKGSYRHIMAIPRQLTGSIVPPTGADETENAGIQLSFNLPPSCYATNCVRELLKRE
eukprot:gb/GECG01013336.1/.p1 GENE.gb/GECG01013336.1/~~gb/GECG01013336.1/.p1  ORF type:complete len:918 (+),score=83.06 gb/GECG01013336.1/:1-2754(+)